MLKLSKIARLTTIAALGSSFFVAPALAQQANTTGTVGLEISAPIYQFTIQPGSVQQDIIKIRNVGSSTQTYYPIVADFKTNNENGTPVFLKPGEENGTYSLSKWISFSKDAITLEPNHSAALNFNIVIPANAEAGGHYAGILFSTKPGETAGTGVGLVSEVGSLILVNVSGPGVNQSAQITEFKSDRPNYPDSSKITFNLTVQNTGNVHVQPKGNITITNLFGGRVAALDVNSSGGNVLPASSRKFQISWSDPNFKLGIYQAKLDLVYGDPSKTISAVTSFWIIPWTTIIVGLIALVVILVLLVLGVKRYNAWIIKRSRQ